MRKKVDARVREMERSIGEKDRSNRHSSDKLRRLIAGAMVVHQPDLKLVEPCDTDPETYRDIAETVALARYDFEEADRLKAMQPVSPRKPPLRTSDGKYDWRANTQRMLDEVSADARNATERHNSAIAAARKRLGMPPTNEHDEHREQENYSNSAE